MSFTLNCCDGMSIKKLICNNCTRSDKKPREEVLYTDRDEQIVILSTPHSEIPDLVVYEDLHRTDLVVFTLDPQGDVRFTSIQGQGLFRSIDRKPPEPTPSGPFLPLSARKDSIKQESKDEKDHKSHPSIATPSDISGRLLKDILPEYMLKFLLPICKQTLQGNYLQLTIMWAGLIQLLRTYPIQDHRKKIVAGMLTISPFVSAFNVDVNRFSMGSLSDQPPSFVHDKRPSKPEVQTMDLGCQPNAEPK